MVGAAVAERQLEGLEAHRAAEQLVAQADAEHGALADQLADRRPRRSRAPPGRRGRWRARPGRDPSPSTSSAVAEHGSKVNRQSRSRSCRMIESLIPVSMPTTCGPSPGELDGLAGSDRPRQVRPQHRRLGLHPLARLGLCELGGEDPAAHRPAVADVAHQRPRVDPADRRHPAVTQPVEPAALGVGGVLGVLGLAHDHPARLSAIGLHRRLRDAVVADQRIGEGDDLARVRGVGDRLLIAGHRGVEDDLAGDQSPPPRSSPSKRAPSSSSTYPLMTGSARSRGPPSAPA